VEDVSRSSGSGCGGGGGASAEVIDEEEMAVEVNGQNSSGLKTM